MSDSHNLSSLYIAWPTLAVMQYWYLWACCMLQALQWHLEDHSPKIAQCVHKYHSGEFTLRKLEIIFSLKRQFIKLISNMVYSDPPSNSKATSNNCEYTAHFWFGTYPLNYASSRSAMFSNSTIVPRLGVKPNLHQLSTNTLCPSLWRPTAYLLSANFLNVWHYSGISFPCLKTIWVSPTLQTTVIIAEPLTLQ